MRVRVGAMRAFIGTTRAPIRPTRVPIAPMALRIRAMHPRIARMRSRRAAMRPRIAASPPRTPQNAAPATPMAPRTTRITGASLPNGRQTVAKAASLSSIGVLSSSAMSFAFSSTEGRTLRAKNCAAATLPS